MISSGQNESDGGVLRPTDMLYLTFEGNFFTECEAEVLQVKKLEEDQVEITLNQTVMHAQGGGQPTDKGTLINPEGSIVLVHKVLYNRDTGCATHYGKIEHGNLSAGDAVQVKIDQEVRQILSECHTAGHVVDSAMARCGKFLKPSKAYHFLDGPYVEYEGSIMPDEKDSLLHELQSAFCQLVEEDIDTKIELMSKEEADTLCNRQAQNFDMDVFADKRSGQIRVVTVAGFPCPCGGTHVRSTASLRERKWGITGFKSKKGVVRVKYGQNASL